MISVGLVGCGRIETAQLQKRITFEGLAREALMLPGVLKL